MCPVSDSVIAMAPQRRRSRDTTVASVKKNKTKKNAAETEKERIAKIIETRKLYAELSRKGLKKTAPTVPIERSTRSKIQINYPNPFEARMRNTRQDQHEFEVVPESLEMIKKNQPLPSFTGRASSIARRNLPRPSLLPLGINIFEANASEQMKVREHLNQKFPLPHQPKTPTASAKRMLFKMDENEEDLPDTRSRVRFGVDTITELRESGGSDVVTASSSTATVVSNTMDVPRSILKKKPSPVLVREEAPPTPPKNARRKLRRSVIREVMDREQVEEPVCHMSDLIRAVEQMDKREIEKKNIKIIDKVLTTLSEWKERIRQAEKSDDESYQLIPLDDSVVEQREQVLADQEIRLINQDKTPRRRSNRLIRNPISSTLGHDSPFISLAKRGAPLFS